MNRILSYEAYQAPIVLASLRVLVGICMVYHGWEIVDKKIMDEYGRWMVDLDFPFPSVAAYFGKASELLSGALLMVGLFTRFSSLLLIITMSVVTFGIGNGRILMEDQHPFLFVVLGLLFLFLGAGDYSLDKKLFNNIK
jgi:putative oxidoreductase